MGLKVILLLAIGQVDLKSIEQKFVQIGEVIKPSVVAIQTYKVLKSPDGEEVVRVTNSNGSGFIANSGGFIVTNYHVVENSDAIEVIMHDKKSYTGTVFNYDSRRDIAIIKINVQNLVTAKYEDDEIQVGQWSFVCGNPFGLASYDGQCSLTHGIISALNRDMTDRFSQPESNRYYGDMIETTAVISPGNSGGGLFNIDGEIIGIVTGVEVSSKSMRDHGFAIPLNSNNRKIINRMIEGDKPSRPYMGVVVIDSMSPRGAKVIDINIPQIDLMIDDVITQFNSVDVLDHNHLIRLVENTAIDSLARVVYVRGKTTQKTSVKIKSKEN